MALDKTLVALPKGCPDQVREVAEAMHLDAVANGLGDRVIFVDADFSISDNYYGRFFRLVLRYYPSTNTWRIGRLYGDDDGRAATLEEVLEEIDGMFSA